MKSGWVFGDTALLFQSPRSASIVASTPIQLWAMDRRTFHKVSCLSLVYLPFAKSLCLFLRVAFALC